LAGKLAQHFRYFRLGKVEDEVFSLATRHDRSSIRLFEHVVLRQTNLGRLLATHERGPQANAVPIRANLVEELFEVRKSLSRVLELAVAPLPFIVDREHSGLHPGGSELFVDLGEKRFVQVLAGLSPGDLSAPSTELRS